MSGPHSIVLPMPMVAVFWVYFSFGFHQFKGLMNIVSGSHAARVLFAAYQDWKLERDM